MKSPRTIIFSCIAVAVNLLVSFMRNTLIIELGIRNTNLITSICTITLFVATIWTLINLITSRRKNKKQKPQIKEESDEALFSSSINPGKLRQYIVANMDAQPYLSFRTDLLSILEQMQKVDDAQIRLSQLLKNNDAVNMRESTEAVDQIETYMCKNVKAVVNNIEITDINDRKQMERTKSSILKCISKNEEALSKTNDFLSALADFLNSRDNTGSELETLEMYKDTILKFVGRS